MKKQEMLEKYVSPGIKVAEVNMKSIIVASGGWSRDGEYQELEDGTFEW